MIHAHAIGDRPGRVLIRTTKGRRIVMSAETALRLADELAEAAEVADRSSEASDLEQWGEYMGRGEDS